MIFKNVGSQGLYVYAYDTTNSVAKTGDASNITAGLTKDGAASGATNDTNPTEIGSGIYWFDLTQAETNADTFALIPASSTSNIQIHPVIVATTAGTIPKIAIGSSGALPTVDANNRISGITGTKNTFDDLNDISTAQVNTECDTALTDYDGPTHAELRTSLGVNGSDVIAELTSIPGATPTLAQAAMLPYMGMRNGGTQTTSTFRVNKDDGGSLGTATVSDDGTTFTKGKMS